MIATPPAKEEALRRVRSEFMEMPGLRLTPPEARRLWGLDVHTCEALLKALVDANFLFQTRDGAFMRVEGRPAFARSASAEGLRAKD